ncbi:MAG: serine/threonine-protein phosphatase [Desulfovibrio sp.]|nr:MAG: serine/threonine-protein phosphatase [Desulfovibrio sp.]
MLFTYASLTHAGNVRPNNEDSLFTQQYGDGSVLAAVADGAGGESAGEVASGLGIKTLMEFNPETWDPEGSLARLVITAHERVLTASTHREDLDGMGSTMTVYYLRDSYVYWAHVGDSRLYLLRDGNPNRLTTDHTIPGLLRFQGEIDEYRARTHPMRNFLLQCLGCRTCEPESGVIDVFPGDILLACSDGLYGELTDETLVQELTNSATLEAKLRKLLDLALDAGGRDNISMVGVHVEKGELARPQE